MRSGLVKRNKGRYALTAFGKVVYDIEITIEIALENLWKLRAVDLVQVEEALSKEEQTRILDTLIDSTKIKDVLLARIS
jgi:hypothetical protein